MTRRHPPPPLPTITASENGPATNLYYQTQWAHSVQTLLQGHTGKQHRQHWPGSDVWPVELPPAIWTKTPQLVRRSGILRQLGMFCTHTFLLKGLCCWCKATENPNRLPGSPLFMSTFFVSRLNAETWKCQKLHRHTVNQCITVIFQVDILQDLHSLRKQVQPLTE